MSLNSHENMSSIQKDLSHPPARNFEVYLESLICLLTVSTNIVIFLVVVLGKVKKSQHNRLIASLALSDLIMGLLCMPLEVVYHYFGEWRLESVTCMIWLSLKVLAHAASTFNLCGIAIDRLWAVSDPFNYKQQPKRNVILIASIWFISFWFAILQVVAFNLWDSSDRRCQHGGPGFTIVLLVILFITPYIIMIGTYSRIFRILKKKGLVISKFTAKCNHVSKHQKQMPGYDVNNKCSRYKNSTLNSLIDAKTFNENTSTEIDFQSIEINTNQNPTQHVQSSNSRETNDKKNPRVNMQSSIKSDKIAVKSTITVGVFITMTLPYLIKMFFKFHYGAIMPRFGDWTYITDWLIYGNSFMNPLLYTSSNHEFRTAYKKLFFSIPKLFSPLS